MGGWTKRPTGSPAFEVYSIHQQTSFHSSYPHEYDDDRRKGKKTIFGGTMRKKKGFLFFSIASGLDGVLARIRPVKSALFCSKLSSPAPRRQFQRVALRSLFNFFSCINKIKLCQIVWNRVQRCQGMARTI